MALTLTTLWLVADPADLQTLENQFRALMTYAQAAKDYESAKLYGRGGLEALGRARDDARRACPETLPL
jgi:hypothetical protein